MDLHDLASKAVFVWPLLQFMGALAVTVLTLLSLERGRAYLLPTTHVENQFSLWVGFALIFLLILRIDMPTPWVGMWIGITVLAWGMFYTAMISKAMRGLDHCLSELIAEREKNKAKSTIRLRVLEGMSGPWARFILWILMGVTHGSAALADMLADDLDFLSGSPFRASVFGLFVVYLLFYLVPAITLQFYCYPKHWLLGAEHLFFLTMALLPGIAVIALAGETYRLHASFLAFNHYAAFHALATFLFMTSLVPSVLHCALSRAPEEEVKRDVEQRPLILEDSDIRIMVEVPQLAMQFPKTVDERDLKTLSSTVLENLARITPRFNSKDAAPAVIFDTPFSGDNTQAFLAMMSDYRIKLLGLAPIIHGMNACVQFVLGQTDSWESVCDACNFEANKLVLPKSVVSEVAAVQAALAVKEKTLDKRLLAFHVLDAYRKILNNIVAVVPHSQS